MHPFEVSAVLDPLTEHYPPADLLLQAAKAGNQEARYAMCRLWLSEGIPFAFKARPSVYEALRIWLARRVRVQAKEITLIGSARQGVSLSTGINAARPFGPNSDLDFSIVSSPFFQCMKDVFLRWAQEYTKGVVHPRSAIEKALWDANKQACSSGLARGFIDPHKTPTWRRYPEVQEVMQALYLIQEKLKITPGAPQVRKVSLRIYRDWDSLVRQMAINLEATARVPPAQLGSRT